MNSKNDIIDYIYNTFNDIVKIKIFSSIKTNNPIFDTILSTIMLTFMSYIVNFLHKKNILDGFFNIKLYNIYDMIKSIFLKKNIIIIEGKKCLTNCIYSSTVSESALFSDRFKAVWAYIVTNIDTNLTVFSIKEMYSVNKTTSHFDKNNSIKDITDLFIVSQNSSFLFNKELQIYATADFDTENTDNEKHKNQTKTETITIKLYSYHTSIANIKKYVDLITTEYLINIEKQRNNKKFIYSLYKNKYDESICECWNEHQFESTRTFDNMFFDSKSEIISHIDFWINNKQWYYEMGIPYTLGIGLHGPPGTGKTSFVKALANMTGRHIIDISFKIIKTKNQLINFFYEDRYNSNNKKNSIGFEDKIIYIDDIDCIGDIFKKRTEKNASNEKRKLQNNNINNNNNNNNNNKTTSSLNVGELVQTIIDSNDCSMKTDEDPITLDDFLNLLDGIRETPNRIFIIASNHWELLDDALIRPGRIDKTIKMGNASHNTISQMYQQYYKCSIDTVKLEKINADFYSPAEITNIYVTFKDDKEAFIKRLMLNKKIN